MKSVVIIINQAPYGDERAYNALRYANALLAAAVQVKVYLLADAVACAKRGQILPKGYYNVENIITGITHRGATVPCAEARGLRAEELIEGTAFGRMDELAQWTAESEGVAVF
jgi:uncharacterized protein involved in oxidation of intracellular sulfur